MADLKTRQSKAQCPNCNGEFAVDPHGLAPNDEHTEGVFCTYCGELIPFHRVEALSWDHQEDQWMIEGDA